MAIFARKTSKHAQDYISAAESRKISRENRRITDRIEKARNRKNVPPEEYITTMRNPDNVAEFDNLHTYFFTDIGTVKAVDGVTFDIPQGKTVGVVGESGCGKSVTSLSLMQLVQRPQGQIVKGAIRVNTGEAVYDIAKTPTEAMQRIRGNYVSMIFQEPMTSLNPVFTIEEQIAEVIRRHLGGRERAIRARGVELLAATGMADPARRYDDYPHQLSGGMK
ncbi:MAG TPA: dipeptide/oligopeptide/nickel ABC transporter ATP-binding protein, partial [Clostridiales bacterium]|nr:dipeptide/oligopeptide/nickel ABC transporter ATP-binding protein [Clostridiales bacterium]